MSEPSLEEVEDTPEPEEQVQIPEDPWADPCPKCGLRGCVAGHY